MFNFIRNLRAKIELMKTRSQRKKELVRLHFDLYHSMKRWEVGRILLDGLRKQSQDLQDQLALENVKGGKTTKTKEKIMELEDKIRSTSKMITEILKYKEDLKNIQHYIPLAEELITSLEECIKSPSQIYDSKLFQKEEDNQRSREGEDGR